jgi:hypothetical protein
MQTSVDNKDREYKQKEFNGVHDIEKWGKRDETNHNVPASVPECSVMLPSWTIMEASTEMCASLFPTDGWTPATT